MALMILFFFLLPCLQCNILWRNSAFIHFFITTESVLCCLPSRSRCNVKQVLWLNMIVEAHYPQVNHYRRQWSETLWSVGWMKSKKKKKEIFSSFLEKNDRLFKAHLLPIVDIYLHRTFCFIDWLTLIYVVQLSFFLHWVLLVVSFLFWQKITYILLVGV